LDSRTPDEQSLLLPGQARVQDGRCWGGLQRLSRTALVVASLAVGLLVGLACARVVPLVRSESSISLSTTPYVFVHITKTGGTSIEEMARLAGTLVGRCKELYGGGLPYQRSTVWGFEFDRWHEPPNRHVLGSWAVVRNPYDRALSDFAWWQALEEPEARVDPNNLDTACPQFDAFLLEMKKTLDNPTFQCMESGGYTEQNYRKCEKLLEANHWPQVRWSHNTPQRAYVPMLDKVFRSEDFEQVINHMRAHVVAYPEAMKEVHVNSRPHGRLSECWTHVSREAMQTFMQLFGADFDALGYDKRPPKAAVGLRKRKLLQFSNRDGANNDEDDDVALGAPNWSYLHEPSCDIPTDLAQQFGRRPTAARPNAVNAVEKVAVASS